MSKPKFGDTRRWLIVKRTGKWHVVQPLAFHSSGNCFDTYEQALADFRDRSQRV